MSTFKTELDGTRSIVNTGSGTENATMNSGQGVYLNAVDQVISVPINFDGVNVFGSVTVFNFDTKVFEQVIATGELGANLVPTGDYSAGISTLVLLDGADTIIQDVDYCKFTNVTANYAGYKHADLGVHTLGIEYTFSFEIELLDSTTLVIAGGDESSTNFTADITSSGIYSFSYIATSGVYIRPKFSLGAGNNVAGREFKVKNVKVSENIKLPLATTYDLSDGTYGAICKLHTAVFTQADLTLFNGEPERLLKWYFGTATIPSGLVKGTDDKVYANLENSSTLTELNNVDALTVTNYTNSVRDTTLNSPYGLQKLRLDETANVPTAVRVGSIASGADGRNIVLPLTSPTNYNVVKDIKKIEGDSTSLTITHVDDTTVVVP
jgi:hypothetical protein